MKKRFLVNFILLLSVNVLVKPAWLFADLLVQRVTQEAYGQYFVLFNLSMMLNMLLDFGISNYNNRKVAGNVNKFQNYFANVVSLRIVLTFLYLIVLTAVGCLLSYQGKELKWLLLLGANQVLLAGITYLRSNLTALSHFSMDRIVSVLDRIVMSSILLFVLFYSAIQINILLFIKIQFIGYLCAFIMALLFVVVKGGAIFPSWNWKFKKTLLIQSFPYALIVLLMSAYSFLDSVMLDVLLPNGVWENMIYAQSFRILMAGNNYAYLIAVLLLPIFSKLIQEKKDVVPLLQLSGSLLIYAVMVFSIIASIFSAELISMLYGQSMEDQTYLERFESPLVSVRNGSEVMYSAKVFAVLILGLIAMSFNYVYGVLLTAGGQMKTLNRIALVGLVGNIVLNWILIPSQGAFGAAIASLSTQGLAAVGQWYFCYKKHAISFRKLHFLKFIGIAVTVIAVSYYSHLYFETVNGITISALTGFLLLFTLKIVSLDSIKTRLLNR